ILRREMRRTAPGALFAAWRGKDAYTREGFEEDRSRILIYYQDHGFPEARIGTPRVSVYEKKASRWIPWPFRTSGKRLAVAVPIEAGAFYRVASVDVSPALVAASGKHGGKLLAYSKSEAGTVRSVESSRTFDSASHMVRVRVGFSDEPPYLVRRMEFSGLHRFSDRYVRRRIGLREGQPFDERALESGLARLARTGYFHSIK